MQIYNVYQSGKRLYIDEKENPDNKIVVNKYDNMQQTLRLISDGTLPPRLYWALRNPKLSNKYFILPLINNEDLIVGTDISAYAGLWDMLLIGTDEDYIIEGIDIDQSRLTYVSDHFGRLFVRDNFLEELDFEEQTSPTFKIFYDEIMFQLENKAEMKDIPDQLSDLENDTNFISGVTFKDDGEGHVEIIGTTFGGGETEEGEIPSGGNIEVDDKLDEESTNPVQNKVIAKEIKTLKDKDKTLDEEVNTLKEHNTQLKETIEKLQIKVTTEKASFHHITDSANMKVLDFGMEGKTTQDGTPTPENQVEIVNAGKYNEETGRYEIGCYVGNKNWYSGENVSGLQQKTIRLNEKIPSGTYVFSAIITSSDTNGTMSNVSFRDDNMKEIATFNLSRNNRASASFTIPVDTNTVVFYAGTNSGSSVGDEFSFTDIQIEKLSVTDFTPHASQPLTLTSPVPLTKWDYLIKRDGVWGWSTFNKEYNPSEILSIACAGYSSDIIRFTIYDIQGVKNTECYCNLFRYSKDANYTLENICTFATGDNITCTVSATYLATYGYAYDSKLSSGENHNNACTAFKALLSDKGGIKVLVNMQEEQAFHPLPDEEQELLNNLEMYYGVTNVYNDQGCPTWLTYIVDNQLYIDNKVQQINNALLSLGANV